MYAVIKTGSFQFRVAEGDIIDAPKLEMEIGKTFDISDVLLVADGENVSVGNPNVKGASVTVEVIAQHLDTKDVNFTFRKRKDARRKIGHRQQLTALKITKIAK
jgi:large subunit ribosomal protein L21